MPNPVLYGGQPPQEALAFMAKKLALKPSEYRQLRQKYQAAAFSVAGMTRLDLLQRMQAKMAGALERGESFGTWKQSALAELREGGMDKLKNHRLRTVYQTNVMQALNAGRWEQLQQTKETHPFLQYVAVDDARTRPEHLALHGKVYPIDHPFWGKWMPPNGFKCRCSVRALSRARAKQIGAAVETKMPPFDPDLGFESNAALDMEKVLHRLEQDKLNSAEVSLAKGYVQRKLAFDPGFKEFMQGKTKGTWPVGILTPKLKDQLGVQGSILELTPPVATKQQTKHEDLGREHYLLLQEVLEKGMEIKDDRPGLVLALALKGAWYRVVLNKNQGRAVLVSFYRDKQAAIVKDLGG